MKVLNLNLHFYPESIGGATVVAEKLAWGVNRHSNGPPDRRPKVTPLAGG